MSKDYKITMPDVNSAVDRRDLDWLSRQPEKAQTEFSVVHMRSASCVQQGMQAAYTLCLINRRVNYRLFDLYHDRDLSFRLLASCGLGRPLARTWVRGKTARSENAALRLLGQFEPLASDAELRMLLRQYDRASFEQFVKECGKQQSRRDKIDEVGELMQAYDKVIHD